MLDLLQKQERSLKHTITDLTDEYLVTLDPARARNLARRIAHVARLSSDVHDDISTALDLNFDPD